MKKLFMLLAILAPAFIMSCSDDPAPTTPPVSTGINLMPLANGNYWIQTTNNLDTLGTILTTQTDTLTSSATMTYKAKSAAALVNTNGGAKDTTYIANEGTKVHISTETYEKILNALASANLPGFSLKLSNDWVKVADYDAATWSEPETQIKDVPITYSGITGVMNGTVKINGKKGTNASVTLNNKAYTANGYEITIVFDGKVSVPALGITEAATIKISVDQKYWFIDGVGLYKQVNGNTSVNVVFNPLLQQANVNQKFGGKDATTTSFKLN